LRLAAEKTCETPRSAAGSLPTSYMSASVRQAGTKAVEATCGASGAVPPTAAMASATFPLVAWGAPPPPAADAPTAARCVVNTMVVEHAVALWMASRSNSRRRP